VKLGHSVLGDEEAVYGGDYLLELKDKLGVLDTDPFVVGKKASTLVVNEYIKPTIEQGMQIHFDTWTSEYDLAESGIIQRAIDIFSEQGRTFEEEGALWLRTTEFGDDKDRVLIKSDGGKTYFASECGYILSKIEQGFTTIIEIWGADHHGYVSRFESAARALGFTGEIKFLLMQLVKLVKDGEEVRMSKRAGNVVTMDELLVLVGHDVTRFFFLQYSPDTHMTFDLGLAEERSQKNPVFYIQYAHARMASILLKGKVDGLEYAGADLSLLVHEKEKTIMREVLMFQEFLELAATDCAPHRLPQLAIRLADKFHSYYGECQVIDTENEEMSRARLALVVATKQVLAETLGLIGVSAPEKM
jgi:arginyl-tRNA synthetase